MVSILTEVGQIPGLVDSVVNEVNKNLDFFPVFLLCYYQHWHGVPIGCNNREHYFLFPVAGCSPSFHLIGPSQVMCLARTNNSQEENAMF